MMSEVEDQARDLEVEGGIPGRHATDNAQPRPTRPAGQDNHESSVKTEANAGETSRKVGEDVDDDNASEAETLIQSPEKRRSIVDSAPYLPPPNGEDRSRRSSSDAASALTGDAQSRKRKRSVGDGQELEISPDPSRRSSPLSSPAAFGGSADGDSDRRTKSKDDGSENAKHKRDSARGESPDFDRSAGVLGVRKRRPSDLVPHKKDKHNVDTAERRETRSATYSRHSDDDRSPSPRPAPRRDHRRGVSTQLTAHEFAVKKRGRPPLINTRRNRSAERAASVSSDDSNSPAPPRSAMSKLAGHDHDTMSPAKTGPRKWRDKNGRTFLARACNNNDLEGAKARLAERPEDLNWADNAGNTPLQIAALEGFTDIVQFLLEASCDVDTRNIDKETPLIDAVENGHIEVVKLLLDHGANPRLGNAKGDEPYELVPQDDENYEAIRALLADAKEREGKRHKIHEQVEAMDRDRASSRAASAASPRDSPPAGPRSPPAFASSRRRTGRSESTRNDLLWQANTQENLTKLAAKGDVQGVASILNILQKAETESLIAAAKAGHEEVLQYLLGMGDPNPDPDPVRTLKPGYNTPMLAAIGKGHPDVIKLLVSQSGFNPMKKHKDKTYFELARDRKGEDWQLEFDILKNAYDNYATSRGRKTGSPRKTRDIEKSKPRSIQRSSSPSSQKRMSSSPTMTLKSLSSTKSSDSSPMEKRKVPDLERRKVSGGKPEIADNSAAISSDLDQNAAATRKGTRVRRSQSDLPPPPKMDIEPTHRRRRLVTGKEHRRNRSQAPGTDSDEDAREMIVVKQEERPTTNLKRARSRSSMSPEPKQPEDSGKSKVGPKKRRTVLESSPDEVRNMTRPSNHHIQPNQLPSSEAPTQSIELLKHDVDVEDVPMIDATTEVLASRVDDGQGLANAPATDGDGPVKLIVLEEAKSQQQLELSKGGSVDIESTGVEKLKVEEEEEEDRLLREEAVQEAKIEAERLAKIEAEEVAATAAAATAAAAAAAEAEAKAEAQRAESARKAAEEEQAKRDAEQRAAEEAETKRKAEEEAVLRKKEEEERQVQMRQEMEDRRRLQYLESERRRRETLPVVLSRCAVMIDENDGSAQSSNWLSKFFPLFTVTTQQLDPNASTSNPDDLWVANFQVASLLATKDLGLRNYTSFEKRHCTPHERQCLWRVARNMLSFEYEPNSFNTSVKRASQREQENRPKFLAMEELFWVKLSDFTDQISRHPHLSGVALNAQPISLASYDSITQRPSPSPQMNGTSLPNAKPANGIVYSRELPTGNGV